MGWVYSDRVLDGILGNRTGGFSWSSTSHSDDWTYDLYLRAEGELYPDDESYRRFGFPIRGIAQKLVFIKPFIKIEITSSKKK